MVMFVVFGARRYLCERAVPGNRVTVVGLYSIKKTQGAKVG